MKWQGRQRSSNIEDRRSSSGSSGGFGRGGGFRLPTGGGGGMRRGGGIGGIGLIIAIGVICLLLGINPLSLLGGVTDTGSGGSSSTPSMSSLPAAGAGQDELADFVSVVVRETEDMWTEKFQAAGETYTPPAVVLFTNQIDSGCGAADARTGPFYCPVDQKVYIDLSFYDQLHDEFGAPGDFAQAYVLAHEIGHHVQNVTGILPEFNRRRASMSEGDANAYSVRVELQADCYAGIWANYVGQENLLDTGDVQEAITAANQIGDDTLQERMQGYAVPKTFNHGTSQQRSNWFQRGYTTGSVQQCDTFSASI